MAWYDITGTIADWIMAGAAVYAALNVKDLLKERTHTQGLQKAENLISEIDRLSSKTNEIVDSLTISSIYFKNFNFSNQLRNTNEIERTIKLQNEIEKQKVLLSELIKNFSSLQRWNISVINKSSIMQLFNEYESFLKSAANSTLNSHAALKEIDKDKQIRDTFIHHFNINYSDCLESLSACHKRYDEFLKFKFTDLFKVTS